MNYEKEYKKLKAGIKNAYLYAQTDSTKAVLENILPELRESEDERIRNEIRNFIWNYPNKLIERNRWLAWIEKQRESQNEVRYWTEEEIEPIISDYLRDTEHYGGMKARLRCLKPKSLEKQEEPNPYSGISFKYNGHTWGMCARDNGVEILVDGEIKERVFLYDRPQGKSALEAAKEEKVDNQNCVKDNYKPKFHEGDWISGYYTNYRVTEINSEGYVVEDTDGNKINILFENEKFHHLWSVQDAKKGDVLYSPCLNLLWIFKDKSSVYCGCNLIYNNGAFCGEGYIEMPTDAIPANKELRDLLFQKMKEAGYEWDAEKKKLRKIELQPSQWNISDFRTWQHIVCDILTKYWGIGQYLDDGFCKKIAKDMQEEWNKKLCLNKDTTWSEEDKELLRRAIIATKDDYPITSNWLKSLRQRIGG